MVGMALKQRQVFQGIETDRMTPHFKHPRVRGFLHPRSRPPQRYQTGSMSRSEDPSFFVSQVPIAGDRMWFEGESEGSKVTMIWYEAHYGVGLWGLLSWV
jgi:hypothetical protein